MKIRREKNVEEIKTNNKKRKKIRKKINTNKNEEKNTIRKKRGVIK